MNTKKSLEDNAKEFENTIIKNFIFLENDYKMARNKVRISNRNSPRDVSLSVRYESETHRYDIGWDIGVNGIGILIWIKQPWEINKKSRVKNYIYFEPFIEYMTNGVEKPIIPCVYEKMSVGNINKVMEERDRLFKMPVSEIIANLSKKFKNYFETIKLQDVSTFEKFHIWMSDHR